MRFVMMMIIVVASLLEFVTSVLSIVYTGKALFADSVESSATVSV